ncbi:MAG: 50S ribosomal protein L10 [Patescibacteria group bacterium]|jgi:large subunit ribosomal protein L10
MAKTRQQKEQALQELTKLLDNKGVVMFGHSGLKVKQMEDLRKDLRKDNLTLTVAKRNLLLLALKNKGLSLADNAITGAVAIAVGDDEVAPAKAVANFKKTNEQVEFYGALINQTALDATAVTNLAKLPSKQELLAKLVGSLQAPITGFVNVLAGNLRGLVNVLNAVKDGKSKAINN